MQTSEIELAEKILTSFGTIKRFFYWHGLTSRSERIRNTLSHEMCHLASWVIDKQIKEGHGKLWKAWRVKPSQALHMWSKIILQDPAGDEEIP